MAPPQTRYAKSGAVNIAYQMVGDGPVDLVLVPGFVSHLEVAWEQPRLAHLLNRLAALLAADRVRQARHRHVRPGRRPAVDGRTDGRSPGGAGRGGLCPSGGVRGLRRRHAEPALRPCLPQRVAGVVLYASWARRVAGTGSIPSARRRRSSRRSSPGWTGRGRPVSGGTAANPAPATTLGTESGGRVICGWPRARPLAENTIRMNMRMDIRDVLPDVRQPVLVLHRTGDTWIEVGHVAYLAAQLPNASYVELPGADHRPWLGDVDAITDEVEMFLTGRKARPRGHGGSVRCAQPARAGGGAAAVRGETATQIAGQLPEQANGGEPPGQRVRQARGRLEGRADPAGGRARPVEDAVSVRM